MRVVARGAGWAAQTDGEIKRLLKWRAEGTWWRLRERGKDDWDREDDNDY